MQLSDINLAVIGLGYVGLPLAVEFAKHRSVIGFDINTARISELSQGRDSTLELTANELRGAARLSFTSDLDVLLRANTFIVTVPTPIDDFKQPDLFPLIRASRVLGSVLKRGDIVIYESTVYPGATEEVCVPELERSSGLKYNDGFFVGYSPERINPGDKVHRVNSIKKITSGSTREIASLVDQLYSQIVEVGTHKAASIKVAEAAKVIENTQRDLNIALINELALIFRKMGIDTEAVLQAAGTKWNFLPFRPGLVGGHCISVDPYYLTHKAQSIGYHPEIILAGRRLNESMAIHVASELVKAMTKRAIHVQGSRVLMLGLTFKENCPDVRNTRVVDVVCELQEYGASVDIHDPWADQAKVREEYGIELLQNPPADTYDAIILAVAHDVYIQWGATEIRKFGADRHVLYDLKYLFEPDETDLRL